MLMVPCYATKKNNLSTKLHCMNPFSPASFRLQQGGEFHTSFPLCPNTHAPLPPMPIG
uniref:Uncharacterized protein n=1 Tax=Setaria italica TaxID=4555 RepID=K3XP65_SETIT